MRASLVLLLLLSTRGLAPGEDSLQPVGYLRAELTAMEPLTIDGRTAVTAHLYNRSDAPLLLRISKYDYQPMFVSVYVPAKVAKVVGIDEAWGPATGEMLIPNLRDLHISGVRDDGMPPSWPPRAGVVVFKDEGYARVITFLPGWIDASEVPRDLVAVVVDAAPTLAVSLPELKAGAVTPGKPVVFAPSQKVYAPGARLIPFKIKATPAPAHEEPAPVPAKDFDLRASIEIAGPVDAGKDLPVIYLIGNHGTKPVWVWQNTLVPALATWEVGKGEKPLAANDKPLAIIDGSSLHALIDLMPERAPIPLNPGEFLTYRRVLLASSLPFKHGTTYQLGFRLEASWFASEPTAQDKALIEPLSATVLFQVK